MGNRSGNAYGLTTLCPIKNGGNQHDSFASLTRDYLQNLPRHEDSPMAAVPNTYLCRFYVLNDVFYEGAPAAEEHLKSRYMVFTSNFYGELQPYIEGMWQAIEADIRQIWQHCVAFDRVACAADFYRYIQQCQVTNNLYFVGSNDEPLAEQLKALYLKQEFSRFAYENQHKQSDPAALQQAFEAFIQRVQPENLTAPTWKAGACEETVIGEKQSEPAADSKPRLETV